MIVSTNKFTGRYILMFPSHSVILYHGSAAIWISRQVRPKGHIHSYHECKRNTRFYSSLALTASQQSSWLCGKGPQELASCACLKPGMYKIISSSLTEKVKDYCDEPHGGNITSALDVFRYYCSAAKDLVVATVSHSASQSHPTSSSSSSTYTTSKAISRMTGSAGAIATSTTAKESSSSGEAEKKNDSDTRIAPIVGGVAGAVVLSALGVGLFLVIRRERQRKSRGERLLDDTDGPPEYPGQMGYSVSVRSDTSNPVIAKLQPAVYSRSRYDGVRSNVGLSSNHAPTAELQAHLARMNHGHAPSMSPPPKYSWRPNMGSQSGNVEAYEMGSSSKVSAK